ncbi:hypothetical protein MTO96_032793 [Rhipicephalus appendiculatus]
MPSVFYIAPSKLTNSSPGIDRIVNSKIGEKEELPAVWKHSEITMIPNPNKPIGIEDRRSIALTSCVREVSGRMAHDR